MLIGIAQIVKGARKPGFKPRRFLVKDDAFTGAAFLCQYRRQRIPEYGLIRHLSDCVTQDLDRQIGTSHVALDTAQIVVTEWGIRASRDIELEHPGCGFPQLEIP